MRIKSVLWFCVYIFVLLILAEIVLHFVKPAPSFFKIDILSYGAPYTLSTNPKLIYVPKPYSGPFNAYGQRGKAFPFKKSEKSRIVFMGDSTVEGLGVSPEERFTDILSKKLGDTYEVINLGVLGYNLLQEAEYLKLLGVKFSPDYVFWGITYNDSILASREIWQLDKVMNETKKNSFYMHYYTVQNKLENLLMASNFYRYFKYYFAGYSRESFLDSVFYVLSDEEIKGLLKEIKSLANRNNFKVIFIFLPTNTDLFADKAASLRSAIKGSGITYLDLDDYFNSADKKDKKKNLFLRNDPCHLGVDGNKTVAEILYESIKNHSLGI
jgi:lysophospholipase L1-like esterase